MWQSSRLRTLVQFFKIGDVVLILCLLGMGVSSWVLLKQRINTAKYCIISVNGRDTHKLLLSEFQKVNVSGTLGEATVEISDKGIRMLSSPCPLKMCVHQGTITTPGQMIICIPNRIIIKIVGEKEVDAVTW